MESAAVKHVVTAGGKTIELGGGVSADADGFWSPALPTAYASSDFTHSSDTAGTVTMPVSPAHPFVENDIVDVFWTNGRRLHVKLTSVGSTSLTLGDAASGTTGDVLPSSHTALTVCKPITVNAAFVGANLAMVVVTAPVRSYVRFLNAGGDITPFEIPAGGGLQWDSSNSLTNPLVAVTVATMVVSTADTAGLSNLTVAILYDSTP